MKNFPEIVPLVYQKSPSIYCINLILKTTEEKNPEISNICIKFHI